MTDADWVAQERKHERDMADMKMRDDRDRRVQRNQMAGYIATAVAAVLIIAALVAGIYAWQHDAGQRDHEVEIACTAAGGTWTQIGGSNASEVCVHIAEIPR